VFLFSDNQIVEESFLGYISSMLESGEVPNLFSPEETEQVINLARPSAKAAGKSDSRPVIWQHFIQIIRESLRIVLVFSPQTPQFRARCYTFPCIVNCSTVDFFDQWPEEALTTIAKQYFSEAPGSLRVSEMTDQLALASSTIHASSAKVAQAMFEKLGRRTHVTPAAYLQQVKRFLASCRSE